ncbi:MAG: hypothetical protein FJX56_10435 [Alphaproteobacteria bacterium]|nr:hypothetical protein [Alphaproteobacteria bacterium]
MARSAGARIGVLLTIVGTMLIPTGCDQEGEGGGVAKVEAPTDPRSESAMEEAMFELYEPFVGRARLAIRDAAVRHAETELPGWEAKGVSIIHHVGTAFLVAVDVSKDTDRDTMNLIARKFYDSNGEGYWGFDQLSTELSGALLSISTMRRDHSSADIEQ